MNRLQNPPQSLAQGANQVHASAQKGTLAVQEGELLPQEPPPQVIRWTGWMLIAIFIAVVLVSVLVHIPETVRCSFVLVPENGADPIQSPLMAVVQAVKVAEARKCRPGPNCSCCVRTKSGRGRRNSKPRKKICEARK